LVQQKSIADFNNAERRGKTVKVAPRDVYLSLNDGLRGGLIKGKYLSRHQDHGGGMLSRKIPTGKTREEESILLPMCGGIRDSEKKYLGRTFLGRSFE